MSDEVERLGPYELRGELGRGAMARVWRAWDPNLEREVAIKEPMFDSNLSEDVLEEMGRRFVKEGKTAARLQHPGIVTVFAADVYDGRPAMVMELVRGATLAELLKRGPMSAADALEVLDQLLDAVGYAHANGVVHRDIKPDNIFVNKGGYVKLSDFGIARVEGGASTTVTVAGTMLGTPGYMSPEQVKGQRVDARSDLFSIGVVAYEMLSGNNPFGAGDDVDLTTVLYRIVHEPAPELPEASASNLPADMRPAIMAALSKDPDDRPQTAADFKAMLHGEVGPPTAKRPGWLPYVAVAGVCVVVLVAVLFAALSGGPVGPVNPSSTASQSTASSSVTSSIAYLAVKDGKVAIYTNSSATPHEVTDIRVSDLDSEKQRELDEHKDFPSVEAAQEEVEDLRRAVEAAKKEAEEKALAEAEAKAYAEAKAKAEVEAAEKAKAEAAAHAAKSATDGRTAFWGVWIGAFKEIDNARKCVSEAQSKGYAAQMYESTDWENLNSDHYYVVSLGEFASRADAEAALPEAQAAGYEDAYVKHTGSRK